MPAKKVPVKPEIVHEAKRAVLPKAAAVPAKRKKVALAIAGVADLLQLVLFPMFMEGALSIPDGVLDGAIAVLLLLVLGFRWRLAAALVLELTPFATLFPSWTAVVMSLPVLPESTPTQAQ